jgi:hypothetical protein
LIHNLGIRRTHYSIFETWGGNLLRAKQNKIQIAFHYVTILQKKINFPNSVFLSIEVWFLQSQPHNLLFVPFVLACFDAPEISCVELLPTQVLVLRIRETLRFSFEEM